MDQTVQNLINALDGLQQWNKSVLQANASKWVCNSTVVIVNWVSDTSPPSTETNKSFSSLLCFFLLTALCALMRELWVCFPSNWMVEITFLLCQEIFLLLPNWWVWLIACVRSTCRFCGQFSWPISAVIICLHLILSTLYMGTSLCKVLQIKAIKNSVFYWEQY